jgi:hypothetical protein
MAYKVFSNGDALTGGELNTFLMNQSVITFASVAARNAAIPAPLEGQLVWLEDSNKYVYYSGSAWVDLIVPASSGNAIINGAFEVNQRNFTTNTTGGYGFDRWTSFQAGGTVTWSAQTFTLGSAPVSGYESRNFSRVVTSGQSAVTDAALFIQNIEDVRTFAGQTVTLSFWAKAGSGTPKIGVELYQNFGAGGSPSSEVSTPAGTVTLSTSWARYSVTIAVPSIAGKTIGTTANTSALALDLWVSAGSTFASRASSIGIQNNTFDLWGVQLESGSSATAFKRNGANIGEELASCQRYYLLVASGNNSPIGSSLNEASNLIYIYVNHPVEMRTAQTIVQTTGSNYYLAGGNSFSQITGIDLKSTRMTELYISSSGLTLGLSRVSRGTNASSNLALSAEL